MSVDATLCREKCHFHSMVFCEETKVTEDTKVSFDNGVEMRGGILEHFGGSLIKIGAFLEDNTHCK